MPREKLPHFLLPVLTGFKEFPLSFLFPSFKQWFPTAPQEVVMQSDDDLSSSRAAMCHPYWRCADTITAPYLHSLPHGCVAPDSLTAGLRCTALWRSGNHNVHQHDVYSETDRVSWPRKIHTCLGKCHKAMKRRLGGRGYADASGTARMMPPSLGRRGRRGELGVRCGTLVLTCQSQLQR